MIIPHKSGIGFDVVPDIYNITVRGGDGAKGDIWMLDVGQSSDAVINNVPGDKASGFTNAVVPTASGVQGGATLVLLMQAISENEQGLGLAEGIADDAFVIAAAGSIAVGDRLVATVPGAGVGGDLDLVDAQGERWVATALEAAATPTARVLKKVWFNGKGGGFGTRGSA